MPCSSGHVARLALLPDPLPGPRLAPQAHLPQPQSPLQGPRTTLQDLEDNAGTHAFEPAQQCTAVLRMEQGCSVGRAPTAGARVSML